MSEPLPSLALGQLTLYAKCSRRLARQLSDDRPSGPSADAPFRLTNAVTEAIRIAHRGHETDALPLDTTLAAIADAPAGLSVEEGLEYRSLIEQYREAFGDDDRVAPDPRSGDNLRRESVAGRFVLSGRADVIVRGDRKSVV